MEAEEVDSGIVFGQYSIETSWTEIERKTEGAEVFSKI
jgi:hypothetical protein